MRLRRFAAAIISLGILSISGVAVAAVGSAYAQSTSQVSACALAKDNAVRAMSQVFAAGVKKRTEHLGECTCDKLGDAGGHENWECTVSWGVDLQT
jgi:hypothetical protein